METKTNMKTHPISISILLTLVLLISTASAVLAAPPKSLHIEVLESIGTSGEAFAATGGAVDSLLVCPTGTVDDLDVSISGSGSSPFRILHVQKRFNCGDSSGSFDVEMVVKLDLTTNATTARWKIVGGTGSYAGLKGNGSLVGTPVEPGVSIHDVYDGFVY